MQQPILEVINASVTIADKTILRQVNFQLYCGEQVAVLGANGSGKTTLLRSLIGMHSLSNGEILLQGRALNLLSQREIASQILYIPNQLQYLPDFTVSEYYQACLSNREFFGVLGASKHCKDRVTNLLDKYAMQNFANRTMVSLSAGELRKILVLTAMLIETPIVMLDEPTSGLDPANTLEVQQLLAELNTFKQRCILHVTHDLVSDLRNANRILTLSSGIIIDEGTPATFLKSERLQAVYGVNYLRLNTPEFELPIVIALPRTQ